ncbi:MAG: N-6 DNA methylase [Prevotella sp.]|nr:N-6 DNA methylase [Prevotella sp.]
MKETFKQIFQNDYPGIDVIASKILSPIFKSRYQGYPQANEIPLNNAAVLANIKKIENVGFVKGGSSGRDTIEIFDVTVNDNSRLAQSRVNIQSCIRSELFPYSHAFMIFHYENPAERSWRFSYAHKSATINGMTDAKRYTYILGRNFHARTITDRFVELAKSYLLDSDLLSAFSVQALSDEFFDKYNSHYCKFCKYLNENTEMRNSFEPFDIDGSGKAIRDYVKKMMGRIVFLYFVQRKGWLNNDLLYMSHLFSQAADDVKADFLDRVLEPMFFGLLNTPCDERETRAQANGWDLSLIPGCDKIPYLNGGLFEQDEIDKCKSVFPSCFFKELFEFFDSYNFTVDENDPNDAEVGIDPEMLGHIFENLLEDNREKGAFYTPKEIVQYMCRESLIAYLNTRTDIGEDRLRQFVLSPEKGVADISREETPKLLSALHTVKICDPAIGSGAFPMGLLNELLHCREALGDSLKRVELKKDIIQNNIYGVDIDQGAVDIARLRFWLSIVVDCEESEPLPNLDYKIMQGNSLLESFMGYDLSRILPVNKNGKTSKTATKAASGNDIQSRIIFEDEQDSIAEIQRLIRCYFSPQNYKRKDTLKQEIDNKVKEYIKICGGNTPSVVEAVEKIDDDNKPFFLWHLFFANVFQKGGFDIVIANPPFGAKLSKSEKEIYKKLYSDVHMRTPETYCYFISLACRLVLKPNGIITYIVPNNMFYQNENLKTRELLVLNNKLIRAINLGDNTFENANVPTCIFTAITGKAKSNYEIAYSDYRRYNVKNIEWWKQIDALDVKMLKNVPSLVLGVSKKDIEIINVIKQNCITIDSIAEEMASGISTGGDKIFKISPQQQIQHNIEHDILRKVLVGGDIDKYSVNYTNDLLIYTTRETEMKDYPNTGNYLQLYIDKLRKRSEAKSGILPWFSLNRDRYEQLFTEPKIIMRQTADSIRCVYDNNGYFTLDSILVLKKNTEKFCYKYIATVLNSKLTDYLYKNFTQEEGKIFAQVKPANVRKLYIPNASAQEQKLLADLYDYMEYLRSGKSHQIHSTISNQFIGDFFEKIINGCVYELVFRSHMKEREINIIEYLLSIIVPPEDDSQQNASTILTVFEKLYKTDNPVRTRLNLFVSRSPEYLQNIIQR